MKSLKEVVIPNFHHIHEEQQSCDETDGMDMADKDVYYHNQNVGKLDTFDGICCDKCNNRGNIAFRKNDSMYLRDCECKSLRRAVKNREHSNMGELLVVSLDTYETNESWQKYVKDHAENYIESKDGWFVMLGQSGCGKTHICASVANEMIKSKPTRYIIWNEFVEDVKQAIRENQDYSLIDEMSEIEVLYIDDLFKFKPTETDLRYCFNIINARYNKKLPTIISSEMMIDQIANLDGAIGGRIKQMAGDNLIQINQDLKKNYRLRLKEVV